MGKRDHGLTGEGQGRGQNQPVSLAYSTMEPPVLHVQGGLVACAG